MTYALHFFVQNDENKLKKRYHDRYYAKTQARDLSTVSFTLNTTLRVYSSTTKLKFVQ